MFFVVSGFLITHHSLQRWQALPRIELAGFYWLRFTRIYPCLLLLLAVLSSLHLLGIPGYVIDPQRSSIGRAVFAAVAFHFNWLEGTRGYLPGAWDVLWSLSVQEAFYVLFPLCCLVLRREAWSVGALALLIALGPVSRALTRGDTPWDEYAYLSCLDCIAFGCIAAWLQQHRARRHAPRAVLPVVVLLLGAALMLFVLVARETVDKLGWVDAGLVPSVLALGTALLLWSFVERPAMAVKLRCSWLHVIGRSSYEIYLTHMFVVLAAADLFQASGADVAWVPAFYAATVLASVALGWAVARGYGQPLAAALRRRTTLNRAPA